MKAVLRSQFRWKKVRLRGSRPCVLTTDVVIKNVGKVPLAVRLSERAAANDDGYRMLPPGAEVSVRRQGATVIEVAGVRGVFKWQRLPERP